MNFTAEHFPVGTVFTVNLPFEHNKYHDRAEYTVTGVVRNGVDSFILETGAFTKDTGELAYNISHVGKIISRGDGPMNIDHSWYGLNIPSKYQKEMESDIIQTEIDHWQPKKGNHYNTIGEMRMVLMFECAKIGKVGMNIDFEKLSDAVASQSWCKTTIIGRWAHVHTVCKKRLRKFLKQNINRFLISKKEMLIAEDLMYCDMYERDMEDMDCAEMTTHSDSFEAGEAHDIGYMDEHDYYSDSDGRRLSDYIAKD